jgi:hypothetical protein
MDTKDFQKLMAEGLSDVAAQNQKQLARTTSDADLNTMLKQLLIEKLGMSDTDLHRKPKKVKKSKPAKPKKKSKREKSAPKKYRSRPTVQEMSSDGTDSESSSESSDSESD